MSDQVKLGGDSKELIQAIDVAEQRFKRFDETVNRTAENTANKWRKMMAENAGMSARIGSTTDPRAIAAAESKRLDGVVDSVISQEARAATRIATARKAAVAGAGHGSGRMAGDLLNMLTGSSGGVMRINALQGLGAGFVGAIGVTAGIAAFEKLHTVIKEASQTAHAFFKELSQRPADIVGQLSQTGILEQMARDKDLEKKARDKSSTVLEPITGRKEFLREQGRRRRGQLEEALVDGGASNVDLAREEASGSGRNAALMKAERDTAEKIAAIELNRNISRQTQLKLIEQENQLLEIQKEKIGVAFDAQERQLALSAKLTTLRANGAGQVEVAEAKATAALVDYDKAHGDGKKAAQEKLGTAIADLAIAKNQQAILESSVRVANFRGTKEDEIANALEQQLKAADMILDKDQRRLAVAQARKAIAENETARELAGITRRASLTSSRIGTRADQDSITASPEQRQRIELQSQIAIAEQLAAAAKERWVASKGGADAEEEARIAGDKVLSARAALATFERDSAFAKDQEMRSAKAVTTEMQLHLQGRDQEAQKVAIIAGYQERIAQAIRDGKNELAGQLQFQQQMALISQRASQLAKSPEQRAAESAEGLNTARLNRTAKAQLDDEADRVARGARPTSGRNGIPFQSQLGRTPGSSLRGGGNPRLSDEDFHNQFTPLSQQATAKHEADNSTDKPKDGASNVIGQISNLISTLNALPGKIGVI